MGVKTVVNSISYANNHVAAATTAGQNVTSLHREILLQTNELIRNLQILLATMQTGDSNISVISAQITALS